MNRLIQCLSVLMLVAMAANVQAQDKTLFFSQYIEGSGDNKAFEIFNPTDAAVDLGDYIVLGNFNGNPFNDTLRFPTGTMLASLDVFVVAHLDADVAITAEADSLVQNPFAGGTSFMTVFNGDDARALYHVSGTDTTLLDIFGDPSVRPSSGWDVAGVSRGTQNHTLVRKAYWESGNTVPSGSFGTNAFNSEWIVLDNGDFTGIGSHTAGGDFTIADLNTYRNFTVFSEDAIEAHPLTGVDVTFTAVIVSYPKSSGLATPNDDNNDGITDDIGRVHVFVTDTSAISKGRAGMSIQIVEDDNREIIEGYVRGDVVTITGSLGFFGGTAQVSAEQVQLLGNVNNEFPAYASLIEPWELTASEINTLNGDGSHEMNLGNYGIYNGAYVKISGATVSNVSTGDRPNWAINEGGSRIYVYDTSLRYRNDRVSYLPSYNYRRGVDPVFQPPAPGAVVNISGFVNYVGDDPDGNVTANSGALSINPMEDGVVWLNEVRFVNGDDLGGGVIFEWPNDLEVLGLPPVFSNVFQSDSSVTSSDAVTISATVVGVEGKTVSGVDLIYSAAGVTDTLAMTAAGDVYTATIPAQANFTPVNFYMIATDSDGLTGRDPLAGAYGYFVQDGAVNAISLIQQTGNGSTGPSPIADQGAFTMDVTATVVSAFGQDGIITIQDGTAMWSGIFLESTAATQALNRGDVINITEATVAEVPVSDFGISSAPVTQLTDLTFTVTSTGADVEALIPSLFTADVVALQADGEIEPYEGMVVKFEDAKLVSVDSFGEFQIANLKMGETEFATSGMIVNEDMRLPFGGTDFPGDANRTAKDDIIWDAVYGIVSPAFGNGLLHPRGLTDMIADNWSNITDFDLISPADSVTVEVVSDIQIAWEDAEDYDIDPVTFTWTLYDAADTSVVVAVPSNSSGVDPTLTLDYATVDGLLASINLNNGESKDFVWNVEARSSADSLKTELYFITLTRGVQVSNEINYETPVRFSLEQNYPNPFNPSTNINFAIPQANRVSLTVYDMLGRKVATLIDGEQLQAANHSVRFDASALASGMYIYRIEAGSFVSTRKMMLIK